MFRRQLWVPFSQAETCFPVAPDSVRYTAYLHQASPASKLWSLRESVPRVRVTPNPRPLLSWTSAPLEFTSKPRSLWPTQT